jgi:hypothetical protein
VCLGEVILELKKAKQATKKLSEKQKVLVR